MACTCSTRGGLRKSAAAASPDRTAARASDASRVYWMLSSVCVACGIPRMSSTSSRWRTATSSSAYAGARPSATKACGTAACAVMAAGYRLRRLDAKATITLPGGDLFMAIRESDGHVMMTGPVEYEFEGDLPPHLAV